MQLLSYRVGSETRLGVLDGYQGLLIAWMAARYVRRKYAKLMRLERGTVQT